MIRIVLSLMMIFAVVVPARAQWSGGLVGIYNSDGDSGEPKTMVLPMVSYRNKWLTVDPAQIKFTDPLPPFIDMSLAVNWMEYLGELMGDDDEDDPELQYLADLSFIVPIPTTDFFLKPSISTELSDTDDRHWGAMTLNRRFNLGEKSWILPAAGYFYKSGGEINENFDVDFGKNSWMPGVQLTHMISLTDKVSNMISISWLQLTDHLSDEERLDANSQVGVFWAINYNF